jgi:hypothetical protein
VQNIHCEQMSGCPRPCVKIQFRLTPTGDAPEAYILPRPVHQLQGWDRCTCVGQPALSPAEGMASGLRRNPDWPSPAAADVLNANPAFSAPLETNLSAANCSLRTIWRLGD